MHVVTGSFVFIYSDDRCLLNTVPTPGPQGPVLLSADLQSVYGMSHIGMIEAFSATSSHGHVEN